MCTKLVSIARPRSLNVLLHYSVIVGVMFLSIELRFLELGAAYEMTATSGDIPNDNSNKPADLFESSSKTRNTAAYSRRMRRKWWHKQAIRFIDTTASIHKHIQEGSREILWAIESPNKMTQYFMNKTLTFGKWFNDWNVDGNDVKQQDNSNMSINKSSSRLAKESEEAELVTFPILRDYPSDIPVSTDCDYDSTNSDMRRGGKMNAVELGSDEYSRRNPLRSVFLKMQEMLYALTGNKMRIKQQQFIDTLAARFSGVHDQGNTLTTDDMYRESVYRDEIGDGKIESLISPFLRFHMGKQPNQRLSLTFAEEDDEMGSFSDYSNLMKHSSVGQPLLHDINTPDEVKREKTYQSPIVYTEDARESERVRSFEPQEVNTNTTDNPDDLVYIKLDGSDRAYCTDGALIVRHTDSTFNIMNESGVIQCLELPAGVKDVSKSVKVNITIDTFLSQYKRLDRVAKNCSIRLSAVECLCSSDAQLLGSKVESSKVKDKCYHLNPKCTTSVVGVFNGQQDIKTLDKNGDTYYLASRKSNITATFRIKCIVVQLTRETLYRFPFLPRQVPNRDKNDNEIRYTLIRNATYEKGNRITFLYEDVLLKVTNVPLNEMRNSPHVFPYLYQYDDQTQRDTMSYNLTSSNPIFYPVREKYAGALSALAAQRLTWQMRRMKGLYFYAQFFNFYHLSKTIINITHLVQIGGAPFPKLHEPPVLPTKDATNWTQVGNILNGLQHFSYSIDMTTFTNDELFAGGRLHGEFGIDGFYVNRDTATLIIDLSDPPKAKYKGQRRVIPWGIIGAGVVLLLVAFAVVVNIIKNHRENQEEKRDRDSNLLLFDEK